MAKTKSSGANFIDRTGQRFGRWLVLHRTSQPKVVRWVCQCDCGTVREVVGSDLVTGGSQSCGCISRDRAAANIRKLNRGAYVSWVGMRQRVQYPGHPEYHRYGGRGISADPTWLESFDAFLADMGPRPAGCSIERIDNDGPYNKLNCVWATRDQQSANTSRAVVVEHDGERMTLKQLACRLGVNYYTLHGAFRKRGLSLAEAIARASSPDRHKRPRLPAKANV
jgi:hypothetical protein